LPSVDDARFDRSAQCPLEVCARHHDQGIAAAELEHALFDLARGSARHCAPGFFAARQRHRFNAWIDNYFFHLIRLDEQRLKNTVVESDAAKDFFNGQRALRNIRRVLQQSDVARQ